MYAPLVLPGSPGRPVPLVPPVLPILGWWVAWPLAARIISLLLALLIAATVVVGGALAVASFAVGSAEVRLENAGCDPIAPPPGLVRRLITLLPVFAVPARAIGPGEAGTYRVPAGSYTVDIRQGEARFSWRFVDQSVTYTRPLVSVTFDGQELLEAGETRLELDRGSEHTAVVTCGP